MAIVTATIEWSCRDGAAFTDKKYSRAHRWRFDGGAVVAASSSPDIVPVPFSDPSAVDPEEAFIASLSSCHMLWFLHLAAAGELVVDRYHDDAVGQMSKDAQGRMAMTLVTLRPMIVFAGEQPGHAQVKSLHAAAHEECFIANSVKTDVRCEPQFG